MHRLYVQYLSLLAKALCWRVCYDAVRVGKRIFGNRGPRVWHFAYGANVQPKVFEGWRGMDVFDAQDVLLRDWVLAFSHPGPVVGHAYADIHRRPGREVYGRLYLISFWDGLKLDFLEGCYFFRRHHRQTLIQGGMRFYTYLATSQQDELRPGKAYLEGMIDAYVQSGMDAPCHAAVLHATTPWDQMPTQPRPGRFFQPHSDASESLKQLSKKLNASGARWVRKLYPHRILGQR